MKRGTQFARAGFAAALMLALAPALAAQAPPGPLPPRPGAPIQQTPPKEERKQDEPQIRVRVELVTTPVTVRDRAGELVLDLLPRDFRIYDNGVEQRIENFDLGGEPISAVLLFETSSRIEPMLPAVRKTGILFTQAVLGQTGEAAIVGFDDTINELLDFTEEDEAIEKSVAQLRMGTSGVRLYDALMRGVNLLRNRPTNRRRVMVVVSEPKDTGSETTLGSVLRDAQLSNITIYSVGLSTTAAMLRGDSAGRGPVAISPPGTFGRPPIPGTVQTPTTEQQRSGNINLGALLVWLVQTAGNAAGDHALDVATAGTGGQHVAAFRDRSIDSAIYEIGSELHAQFSLAYRPSGVDPSGYHEIKVEVARPGVTVRARPGYYLPPADK